MVQDRPTVTTDARPQLGTIIMLSCQHEK